MELDELLIRFINVNSFKSVFKSVKSLQDKDFPPPPVLLPPPSFPSASTSATSPTETTHCSARVFSKFPIFIGRGKDLVVNSALSILVVLLVSESKSTDKVLKALAGVVYTDGLIPRLSFSRSNCTKTSGFWATMYVDTCGADAFDEIIKDS